VSRSRPKSACATSPPRSAGPRDAAAVERDLAILRNFARVYCRRHHGTRGGLCSDCTALVAYARRRLSACPYDPKPKCKLCPTHCYKPAMRARVREVMKFSGLYYVRRGRLDWLLKYFLSGG
jgi:hypothetical protein